MQEVKLRDAKAKLSSLVDEALDGRPSVITRHGRPEAIVLSLEEWRRLAQAGSFGRFIWDAPFEEGDVPERERRPPRDVDL